MRQHLVGGRGEPDRSTRLFLLNISILKSGKRKTLNSLMKIVLK